MLGDAVGACGDFALEDLFSEDLYLDIVKGTYKKELAIAEVTEITLPSEGMLWKKIEGFLKKHGIEKPNKGSVAKRLRNRLSQMKDANELPDETKEKAITLFQEIRGAFGED